MKLTVEQIDRLYLFTRQHYVEWYDLQTELVDHLANAIETQWQENPKLSFDEALSREFKKFGVFGFMDVVESRQRVLGKKYNRIILKHFKTFFGVPKIVLTIVMTLSLYFILKASQYNAYILISLYFSIIVYSFYEMIKNRRARKKKVNQKIWLLEDIINQYGSLSGAIILPLHIFLRLFNQSEYFLTNEYWLFVMCFFLVIISIINYIIFRVIPSKATEYLLETYPEYKLEKP
ncbi:hypothetical protein [Flavobacterium sp. K5-23]|uniref:hypothetical protein n=1 Tax=Flavobacterium sp. K5-23 TaxID=2746225 RepID=UPI00200D4F0B|nr:hypothetical protein [Flavobacterium sp. K5-23]UQD55550.1 hypothetical protein FLAK523_03735 [Flavobacterium sp. K5-23]